MGPRAVPLALTVLALLVRVGAALLLPQIPRDAVTFVRLAALFHDGRGGEALAHWQHPLFPWLVSLLLRGDGLVAGTALAAVAGALVTLPLHALARRALGERAAHAAAFLHAILPFPVRFAAAPLSEGLFGLCAVSAAALALGPGRLAAGAAGLAAGLAYLTRPEGALLAAGLAPAPLLAREGGARALRVGLFAAAFAVAAAPYAVTLSRAEGTLTLTRKKSVAAMAALEEGPAGGGAAPLLLVQRLGEALHPLGAAFFVLGLLAARPRRAALALVPPLVLWALVLARLPASHGYLGRRHVYGLALLLLPWAGAGLAFLTDVLRRRLPRAAALPALVALVVLVPDALRPRGARVPDEREAGRWILAERGPGLRLFAPGLPRAPFYARGVDVAPESPRDAPFPAVPPDLVVAPAAPAPGWRELRRFGALGVWGR
jgi:hypothetical protein